MFEYRLLQETDEDNVFKVIDEGNDIEPLTKKYNNESLRDENKKLILMRLITEYHPARPKQIEPPY